MLTMSSVYSKFRLLEPSICSKCPITQTKSHFFLKSNTKFLENRDFIVYRKRKQHPNVIISKLLRASFSVSYTGMYTMDLMSGSLIMNSVFSEILTFGTLEFSKFPITQTKPRLFLLSQTLHFCPRFLKLPDF